MLTRLVCRNYRALEELDIDLNPLTVLVGPNGAGKSTVLAALSFLLGERWPGFSQLDVPGDFTALDNTRSLVIRAHFDPPLTYEDALDKVHDVESLEFRCQPYRRRTGDNVPGDLRDIHQPLGPDEKQLTVCVRRPQAGGHKPQFAPLTTVSSGLREQARVLVIAESRSIVSQLPGRRGSILRGLLEEARRSFLRDAQGERTGFRAQYEEAMRALRTDEVRSVESMIEDTAKRMLGFIGSEAAASLSIQFGFADPGNPHSSLRLLCRRHGMLLPAEALGLGEQSAIVVGMFEAFRQKGVNRNCILFEEPEMYLHPQAQRYLKRLIVELVEDGNAQVILTTHSPIFADMTRFRSIRMMRRSESGASKVTRAESREDIGFLDEQLRHAKLTQYFDAQTGEVLFARAALLVEGHGDRLAAQEVASKLGIDLDAEGLSIVACGGKNAIPFYARACRALGVPFVVLHDADVYAGDDLLDWQRRENAAAPAANALIVEASGDADVVFTVTPTLEAALGIGRSAASKPMRVLERVRHLNVAALPRALTDAVRALAQN